MKLSQNIFILSACLLFSCKQNNNEYSPIRDKQDSSGVITQLERISPAGVYSGIVPCADCIGLEYTLYLQPDNTYFLRQIYYKEPIGKYIMVDSGKWLEKDSAMIELEYGESKILFREEKNSLLMLDGDGKEITDMPANFRLARIGTY